MRQCPPYANHDKHSGKIRETGLRGPSLKTDVNINTPSSLGSLLFASCMVFCSVLPASGQITDADALRLALKAVEPTFIREYERNHRRDVDLERIFSEAANGTQIPRPFIFRFWCDQCSEGWFESVVAVSPEGKVFELRGRDGVQHFESLSEDYHVKLRSNEDVEHYLAWYLAANPGNWWEREKLDTLDQIEVLAKRKFDEIRAFAPPEANFDNWWRKHRKEAMNLHLGDEITTTANGFRVRFYILSDVDDKHPKDRPAFLKESIDFSADGKVAEPKTRKKTKYIG